MISLCDTSARIVRALLLCAIAVLLAAPAAAQNRNTLRIGYQKYRTLIILKARGSLEKRLGSLAIDVKWIEFPAGPQLLEALNGGSIDFGTVGEAPPIFAQATGADLVYVGHEPPAPAGEALVVPKASAMRTAADLKGKRVALNKGSNVHYLLVKVLEKNGLAYKDVEPVFLPPNEARTAFESASVDAWVIWDPFLATAEKQLGARVLANGTGVASNHQFYVATRAYADRRRDVVRIVLEEIDKVDRWGKAHPHEVSAFLAKEVGLDDAVVALALGRHAYGVQPMSNDVVKAQQKIADTFFELQLIPKRIAIRDAVWKK